MAASGQSEFVRTPSLYVKHGIECTRVEAPSAVISRMRRPQPSIRRLRRQACWCPMGPMDSSLLRRSVADPVRRRVHCQTKKKGRADHRASARIAECRSGQQFREHARRGKTDPRRPAGRALPGGVVQRGASRGPRGASNRGADCRSRFTRAARRRSSRWPTVALPCRVR
jgi:hypothetical protein